MQEQFLQKYKVIWILVGVGILLALQSVLPVVSGLTDPGGRSLPDYSIISRPPSWLVFPISEWINIFFDYLQNDLGLSVFTRAIAQAIRFVLEVVQNIFLGGRKGLGLPALPWVTVAAIFFMLGYYLQGIRLALLTGLSFVYFAVFGQWVLTMETLSLVLVATFISFSVGIFWGVLAWRFKRLEQILLPLMNLLQSMPHFAYLIPVVVFFGVGFHAGAIATIIFATPPMVRMTILGLNLVSQEVVEAGQMNGCTPMQLLFKVRLPSARREILIGINQVIMQSLAMVVIASFIGAPGLGYRLLQLLQSLKLGKSLELGVSVVLIALCLDRLSLAWANKLPDYRTDAQSLFQRYRSGLIFIGVVGVTLLIAQIIPYLYEVPRDLKLSTSPFWDEIIDWITFTLFDPMQVVRTFLSLKVLIPMRNFYLYLPWLAVLFIAVGSAYIVGGRRAIWLPLTYVGFIAISGWWDRAMITAYMVSFALIVCMAIGFPIGVWAALNERRSRFFLFLMDTLQTFPSFIYLIPVIMLFQVNDVAAITAVLAYTFVPIIRYTIEGIRAVPEQMGEACDMCGCTTWQGLWKVKIPLALPHIMIGVNQALMFALFMAIIAAFIGTQDLGQEMMRALAFSDVGRALVLGLCVAFIGLTVDYISTLWAMKRKEQLGLV